MSAILPRYTEVPPYLSIADVFAMHARCMWHGFAWGCA